VVTIRVRIDPADPQTMKAARVDLARVDATTEEEIQAHKEKDEKEARREARRRAWLASHDGGAKGSARTNKSLSLDDS